MHITSTKQNSKPTIHHGVPLRFDGKSIRPGDSSKGELLNGSIISTSNEGTFNPATDQVLLFTEPGEKLTADSFSSVAANLGDKTWNADELAESGFGFGFDRNQDGAVEVNSSGVGVIWKKAKNFVGEGSASFNGKETITVADKQSVARGVFKNLNLKLDAANGTLEQSYTFDEKAYGAYSDRIDRSRLIAGGTAVAGIGTFLAIKSMESVSPALAILGVGGLVVGVMGGLTATIAKLDPDIPVRY
jgi:hypothetical protein